VVCIRPQNRTDSRRVKRYFSAYEGLSPASIRSYRDGIRLFLLFVARKNGRPVTKLSLEDMTADQVRAFLTYLEAERDNHVRSRNQRLTMLHTFFAFAAGRVPELLHEAERVAAIPQKRCQPPTTHYLERDEIEAFFAQLPKGGRNAVRDRAVLLFLYNTGARASEAVGASIQDLSLAPPARVNLHGKGDKWRACPLWPETARILKQMLQSRKQPLAGTAPVFTSSTGRPLTRFGLYKLVKRYAIAMTAYRLTCLGIRPPFISLKPASKST